MNYLEVIDAAVVELGSISEDDPMVAERKAVIILLSLVPKEVVQAYLDLQKRCF